MPAPTYYDAEQRHVFRTVACPRCAQPVVYLWKFAGRCNVPVDAATVAVADKEYDSSKHRLHFKTCPERHGQIKRNRS